jgi:hypothetical protein
MNTEGICLQPSVQSLPVSPCRSTERQGVPADLLLVAGSPWPHTAPLHGHLRQSRQRFSLLAIALPIPDAAPVTTAPLPFNMFMFNSPVTALECAPLAKVGIVSRI